MKHAHVIAAGNKWLPAPLTPSERPEHPSRTKTTTPLPSPLVPPLPCRLSNASHRTAPLTHRVDRSEVEAGGVGERGQHSLAHQHALLGVTSV